jgi:hypothetical protein
MPTQFNVRSLLALTFWVSLWLGGWGWMRHLSRDPVVMSPTEDTISSITLYAVLITCPFAAFGLIVGHARSGIIAGIVVTAVVFLLFSIFGPIWQ